MLSPPPRVRVIGESTPRMLAPPHLPTNPTPSTRRPIARARLPHPVSVTYTLALCPVPNAWHKPMRNLTFTLGLRS